MTQSVAPWCARLIREFTASDARAETIARTLSHDELNWQPRPGAWGVGQCLEHLAMGNELYADAIEAALTRNLAGGAVPEIAPGRFSRWFIRSYIAPSAETKRGKAPGKIVPRDAVDPHTLDRFLRSNERVRAIARRAVEYDVNRVRFRNPFAPVIRFTVGTGLELLSRHEDRHLLQAERVRASAGFPARPAATPIR